MNLSFDYQELIDELKQDIAEFGDFELEAFSHIKTIPLPEETLSIEVYTDYDFLQSEIDNPALYELGEQVPEPIMPGKHEKIEIMNASKLLEILIKQNSIS